MAIANKKTKAKKTAPKKPAAKKTTPKKQVAKKPTPKKPAAKKSTPKKPAPKKPAAKKTTPNKKQVAKKPVAKKSTPKKQVAKKTAPKKPAAKKTTPKKQVAKKPAAKKSTPKKAKAKRRNSSSSRTVYINKRLVKLPKRIGVESYSCIWRMYRMIDSDTNSYYNKRFWIVIGDGHKKYRKFNNIHEAIRYFRLLKKYARMRVQSVHSKKFIRTVYTFYEMAWSGIELDEIKKIEDSWKTTKININDIDDDDFEDGYTKYDTKEVDYGEFNEEEVNKILAEKEGDSLVIEDVEISKPKEEPKKEEEKEDTRFFGGTTEEKIEEPKNNTEVVEPKTEEVQNDKTVYNIYNTYNTTNNYQNPSQPEPQQETTSYIDFEQQPNNLYDPVDDNVYQNNIIDGEKYAVFTGYEDDEEDFGITQHQTSLTPTSSILIEGGSHSKRYKVGIILTLIIVFITLILIILFSLAFTIWKEPFLSWINSIFSK